MNDGTRVNTRALWAKRRVEIKSGKALAADAGFQKSMINKIEIIG